MNMNMNIVKMNQDVLILIASVSIMFVAVLLILVNSVASNDRNFTAISNNTKVTIENQQLILQALKEIRNITSGNPQTSLGEQKELFQDVKDIKRALNLTD